MSNECIELRTIKYKSMLLTGKADEVKETAEQAEAMRFIDFTYVKGKNTPIKVYEVYDYEPDPIKEMKIKIQSFFEEAFEAYLDGNFKEAFRLYRKLIKEVGGHRYIKGVCADPVLHVLSNRCELLAQKTEKGTFNIEEWDGVYRH